MMFKYDLLFTQELQEPSLTFWSRFTSYSIDAQSNQQYASYLQLKLPSYLVQGIFLLNYPYCLPDNVLQAFTYKNKPEVENDWNDIRSLCNL